MNKGSIALIVLYVVVALMNIVIGIGIGTGFLDAQTVAEQVMDKIIIASMFLSCALGVKK